MEAEVESVSHRRISICRRVAFRSQAVGLRPDGTAEGCRYMRLSPEMLPAPRLQFVGHTFRVAQEIFGGA